MYVLLIITSVCWHHKQKLFVKYFGAIIIYRRQFSRNLILFMLLRIR